MNYDLVCRYKDQETYWLYNIAKNSPTLTSAHLDKAFYTSYNGVAAGSAWEKEAVCLAGFFS